MATIRTEQLIPHPPARVWWALTDPAALARWVMANNFQPELGHRFAFDTGGWGLTQCEITELEPDRRLQYAWNNAPLETMVTWTLTPEGDGTRLTLEHSGFDLDNPRHRAAFDGMSPGWANMLAERLPRVLNEAS